jgi:quinolinate synthase
MTFEEYARMPEADLVRRCEELKRAKNAVILGHNYQVGPVQLVSDFLGDSLRLAQLATESDADTIVLCGVHFMAESAKILNPDKKVLLPSTSAGCPMADMITADQLRAFKVEHPGAPVVCYVNTSAAVKAESDVCCTSSNAVRVVGSLDAERVLFVPDRNLAAYAASQTGRTVIPWDGYCYVHNMFVTEDIVQARAEHPDSPVVVHPECPPEVTAAADFVASTGGMVKLAAEHESLVVGTEIGLVERLNREFPDKRFHPLSAFAVCRNMKMIDLPRTVWALDNEMHEIDVPADVMEGARRALTRMLEC